MPPGPRRRARTAERVGGPWLTREVGADYKSSAVRPVDPCRAPSQPRRATADGGDDDRARHPRPGHRGLGPRRAERRRRRRRPTVGSGPPLLIRPATLPTPVAGRGGPPPGPGHHRHHPPPRPPGRPGRPAPAGRRRRRSPWPCGASSTTWAARSPSSASSSGRRPACSARRSPPRSAAPSTPCRPSPSPRSRPRVTDELGLAARGPASPSSTPSRSPRRRWPSCTGPCCPTAARSRSRSCGPASSTPMAVDLAVIGPLFGFLGRQVAIGIAGELPSLVSGLAEQLRRGGRPAQRGPVHPVVRAPAPAPCSSTASRVPLPIEGYVTKRVLVMEFLDGVAVDDTDGHRGARHRPRAPGAGLRQGVVRHRAVHRRLPRRHPRRQPPRHHRRRARRHRLGHRRAAGRRHPAVLPPGRRGRPRRRVGLGRRVAARQGHLRPDPRRSASASTTR